MKRYLKVCAILLFCAFSLPILAQDLYFIDAHSQVDHQLDDLSLILERMDEAGVHKTILASRGRRPHSDIADMVAMHPERIAGAIRTKGRIYVDNSPKFYKKLHKRANSGRYSAVAEILIYHAQKGNKADEVNVELTDPRVGAVLKVCLDNNWPMTLHIEFSSVFGDRRKEMMGNLESFIRRQPEHPFVLIHMGQLDAGEVKRLIGEHPNLYFMVSHTNPVVTSQSNQPWTELFSGDLLKPDWKQLMTRHPDRFVFALDNVWERHWNKFYLEQMRVWRTALSELPDDVAHQFAHGNAERLWKLPPKL